MYKTIKAAKVGIHSWRVDERSFDQGEYKLYKNDELIKRAWSLVGITSFLMGADYMAYEELFNNGLYN